MLSVSQSEQLRGLLLAELKRLAANAHSVLGFTMDRDRDRIGRDSMDESAEEELYSTQLRLADRETGLIAKYQDAIRRLDAGTIDECDECSEGIGFKRLLARPVATLCFECKQAREKTEHDEVAS
jgi:DnaK suppressor protein